MKRRVLAAAAAIVLGLGALAGASPATADGHNAPYVALGDSMASGNGNLPYVDAACLRSARSYPMQVSAATGMPVVSAACTGALTTDLDPDTKDVATQIAGLVASGDLGPGTLLVTLTVGINDLGWQYALGVCGTPGMEAACAEAIQAMAAAGAQVPAKIFGLLTAVRTYAPTAAIVVTGYPKLFGEVAKSCSIGNLGGTPVKLPASLTAMANMAIDGALDAQFPPSPDPAAPADPAPGLNDAIAGATWAFAWQDPAQKTMFVDVDPAFQTHRLCDTGDRWISGLVRGAPVTDRGLHPNAAGMSAFANSILSLMP